MERKTINGIPHIVGYHTQEFRPTEQPLDNPIKYLVKNAWLGIGYYFWTEIEFGHYWGEDFKKKYSGYYDIYKADLDVSNFINSVFDEDGYFFLRNKIEQTLDHFKKYNKDISLEMIHRFMSDEIWSKLGIKGIIYDDKPVNPKRSERTYSEIPNLYYKKRIQIVSFELNNIHKFGLYLEEQN